MHLILLHGYLLQGTGSNIYVSNIAKAWRDQGHAVTIICQDRAAAEFALVNEFIGPDEEIPSTPPAAGRIRVVIPEIGDVLPVYVFDLYPGFRVKTIPEMSTQEINRHIEMTASVVRRVACQGTDRVLANHALFGPMIAQRAVMDLSVPYDVKIHGSAIEYTLAPHSRLKPYAVEGLSNAEWIFVGSCHVRERVLELFAHEKERLQLGRKLKIVPPGMDPDVFVFESDFTATQSRFLSKIEKKIHKNSEGRRRTPWPAFRERCPDEIHKILRLRGQSYDQRAADADLLEKWPALREDEPIVIYFGKFLAAKGVGEVLLTLPSVLARIPRVRFLFVGFGTYREHMEGMIRAFASGDLEAFTSLARAGTFIDGVNFKRWFRKLTRDELSRITITGMLEHDNLRDLLPLASLSLVPSKRPEAFGMVAVESMASGVLPLCNYHAGLRDIVDTVRSFKPELGDLMSLDFGQFVEQIPVKIQQGLEYLYPRGFGDSSVRQETGRLLRQIAVEKYSWRGIAERLLQQSIRKTRFIGGS